MQRAFCCFSPTILRLECKLSALFQFISSRNSERPRLPPPLITSMQSHPAKGLLRCSAVVVVVDVLKRQRHTGLSSINRTICLLLLLLLLWSFSARPSVRSQSVVVGAEEELSCNMFIPPCLPSFMVISSSQWQQVNSNWKGHRLPIYNLTSVGEENIKYNSSDLLARTSSAG